MLFRQVAEYMLTHSSYQDCFITGSSVHNQRRLWRDTYRCIVSLYYHIFYYLQDKELLDPNSDCDLFCLHLVYKEKINYTLKSFTEGWNNHGLILFNYSHVEYCFLIKLKTVLS